MEQKQLSMDFQQAMGETLRDFICPPVSVEEATPHDCCEVIWAVLGSDISPSKLAGLSKSQIAALSNYFGEYFECDPPTPKQVNDAITHLLLRWPVDSLDEVI